MKNILFLFLIFNFSLSAQTPCVDVTCRLANVQKDSLLTEKEVELIQKAENLDAFYFYAGKYGLSQRGSNYGFVDKKGEIVIPYLFEEASSFDKKTGFAKVKQQYYDYYALLDTLGEMYKLATNEANINKLTRAIDLSNQRLTSISKQLLEQAELEILILRNNKIPAIPDSISKLKKLRVLNLEENKLDTLSETIKALTHLTCLNLNANDLKTIPTWIEALKNLENLSCSSNRLRDLPKSIESLNHLTHLYLNNNRLDTLSEAIEKLTNLRTLDLAYNNLHSFPKGITKLKNLKILGLTRNDLISLPTSAA